MIHKLIVASLTLLVALLASALCLTVSLTWFAWHEKATVESGMRNTSAMIREVTLTAKNLREASDVWKQASTDQSSAITSAAQNASVAAKQLSQSASALEKSSTALLNELTRDASEENAQLLLNQTQFQTNLREIQGATTELQHALRDVDGQVNNPAIAQTLENIDGASKNAADGLGEATKSLTDVRQVADKFRETYLKPVNIWWATVEKILGIGPPIVTAIK